MKDWLVLLMLVVLAFVMATVLVAPYEVVRFLKPVFEFFGY